MDKKERIENLKLDIIRYKELEAEYDAKMKAAHTERERYAHERIKAAEELYDLEHPDEGWDGIK